MSTHFALLYVTAAVTVSLTLSGYRNRQYVAVFLTQSTLMSKNL